MEDTATAWGAFGLQLETVLSVARYLNFNFTLKVLQSSRERKRKNHEVYGCFGLH